MESHKAKLPAVLCGLGAATAFLTLITAYVVQTYWGYGFQRYLLKLWVGRALWTAVALLLVGSALFLFSKRNEFSRGRKIMISVLILAVLGLSAANLDLRVSPTVNQSVGRYSFSEDWVSRNVKNWQRALAHLKGKPGVRGLEIGSFEGRSAIWFLENVLTDPSSSITCIDIFFDEYEKIFDANMKHFGDRVIKIRAPSHQGLRNLIPGSYDFVYIDGSHWAKDVFLDAALSWDLIKPGGIIIFDDYDWERRYKGEAYNPKLGIDTFLNVMEPYIDVIEKGYQAIIRKRTEFNKNSPQAVGGPD